MSAVPVYVHPPDDRLDYTYNFGPLLDEGETISTHQVTGQLATVTDVQADGTQVTCWAEALTGTIAVLTFSIATTQGREHTREVKLDVRRL